MSGIRRRDGRPVWIDETHQSNSTLARTDLAGRSGAKFDEAWLQNLLHRNPSVFPTEQIEPGFGDLIPVCRELIVQLGAGRTGQLDNLFVTRDGGLAFIEAKLWRNPEARRAVVAQAMEYAAAVFRLSYDELQAGILRARLPDDRPAQSLVEIVSWFTHELDEAEFIDAVSRNLARGRAIIAVVGDGIREDILPLAELLQSHAGHRFTFALVELAVFEAPVDGVRVVIPSVLAQTTLIERGVIRIEGTVPAGMTIEAPAQVQAADATTHRRAVSIGEDEFYELLARRDPTWPDLLKAFLQKAEDVGLYVERKGGLNIKHASPKGPPLNIAAIAKDGTIDTQPATWWNRYEQGREYNEVVARAIDGFVKEIKGGTEAAVRTSDGKMPRIPDLLPEHAQVWLDAAQRYIESVFEAAGAETR